jgi:hypothetical protein
MDPRVHSWLFALSHQGVAHRHIAISWGFHHRSTPPPATWFPPMSLTPSAPPPQTWPITCNQFYFHYPDFTYFEELLRKFDFKLQSILPSGAKPQYPTACTKESCVTCLARRLHWRWHPQSQQLLLPRSSLAESHKKCQRFQMFCLVTYTHRKWIQSDSSLSPPSTLSSHTSPSSTIQNRTKPLHPRERYKIKQI